MSCLYGIYSNLQIGDDNLRMFYCTKMRVLYCRISVGDTTETQSHIYLETKPQNRVSLAIVAFY